ncbi:MAG: hypothetical protein ABWZ98_12635 [Nakamurella sp.]
MATDAIVAVDRNCSPWAHPGRTAGILPCTSLAEAGRIHLVGSNDITAGKYNGGLAWTSRSV